MEPSIIGAIICSCNSADFQAAVKKERPARSQTTVLPRRMAGDLEGLAGQIVFTCQFLFFAGHADILAHQKYFCNNYFTTHEKTTTSLRPLQQAHQRQVQQLRLECSLWRCFLWPACTAQALHNQHQIPHHLPEHQRA